VETKGLHSGTGLAHMTVCRSKDQEPWRFKMKALILALSLVVVYEASAKDVKENREIAGQMMKKKKKESMWAKNLREKLSKSAVVIRTM
jgi:hypothetical protein